MRHHDDLQDSSHNRPPEHDSITYVMANAIVIFDHRHIWRHITTDNTLTSSTAAIMAPKDTTQYQRDYNYLPPIQEYGVDRAYYIQKVDTLFNVNSR